MEKMKKMKVENWLVYGMIVSVIGLSLGVLSHASYYKFYPAFEQLIKAFGGK